jgi:hypothetical protein
MRKFLIFSAVLLFIFPLLAVTLVSLAIEDNPRVERKVVLTPDHIGRAKKIVDAHRYWVRPGMLAAARITPADADLAANYLARRLFKGSAQVTLGERRAAIRLSLPVSAITFGQHFNPLLNFYRNSHINLQTFVVETSGLPQIRSLQIGKLTLPDALIDVMMPHLLQRLRESPEYRAGLDALHLVKVSPDELRVVYRWGGGLSREMGPSLVGKQDRERLLHYQRLLTANSKKGPATVSLAEVLSPLARAAASRSVSGDPLAENRAVILVLASHVLGISMDRILPSRATWPRPAPQTVTIDGRDDFAKHFMVSAAIAAYADTALADAIGLYKEIEDSRQGSGFSFNDLAADRAGTRFGEKAVATRVSAQQLQYRIMSGLEDRDLMPPWSDLPEFMPEPEFKRRFGGIDAPAYQEVMRQIEQRVSALPLLQ